VRRKIFSIWSVLLVLVVSIAVLVSGCGGGDGEGEQCYIEVWATLCGNPWGGPVQYTLTGPGAASPITGTSVSDIFTVDCGNWTCAYVSGGPPGAYFVDITPSPTQSVSGGHAIVFTLNFELEQDASIEFLSWAISGPEVAPNTAATAYDVTEHDIIDVRYKQLVDGCQGKVVSVNETSELLVHYYSPVGGPPVDGHVLGDSCCVPDGVLNSAVFKDPLMAGPVSLVPSINGIPVACCTNFTLPWGQDVTLDIETAWQLPKSIEQFKFIRWLCIGGCDERHCSLFELYQADVPVVLELRSRAKVVLVDDEDVNPGNDSTDWSPPLYIRIVPPGP